MKFEEIIMDPIAFYPGFPHITELIFQNVGMDSLKSCRLVSKSWLEYIDNQNLLWDKVIDVQNANQAFQSACNDGFPNMVKFLIKKSTDFKIDLNYRSEVHSFQTPFYLACLKGHSKVVEILVQESSEAMWLLCLSLLISQLQHLHEP